MAEAAVDPSRLTGLRSVGAGLLTGVLSLLVTVSFVMVTFSGPLEPFRAPAMGFALFGGLVIAVGAAFSASRTGAVWQTQSVAVVPVSFGTALIGARLSGAPPETVFATAVLFVALAGCVTGAVMTAFGATRLGQVAKFMPYPVIAGFLAATGVFLIDRALGLHGLHPADALGAPGLSDGRALLSGAAVLVVGFGILLARLRFGRLALPVAIVAILICVYGYLAVTGQSLDAARATGELIGGQTAAFRFFPAEAPDFIALADREMLFDLVPLMFSVAGLSVLGLLLSSYSIEFATELPTDLNRDLRAGGLANAIAGLGGGFVGYPSPSMSHLAAGLTDAPSSPLVGWTGVLVFLAAIAGGAALIPYLPTALFSSMLCYLGFEMLHRTIWTGLRQMQRGDILLILLILVTTMLFGFVAAVALGLVAASLLFTVTYSRIDVIRHEISGRLRRSSTERPDSMNTYLARHGDETLIFELQGYLFFGTANRVLDHLILRIETSPVRIRSLIVDFRRIDGMDVSTAFMFRKIIQVARRSGVELLFTGLSSQQETQLARADAVEDVRIFPTLDEGLVWIEDRALERGPDRVDDGMEVPGAGLSALLDRMAQVSPTLAVARRSVTAGTVVIQQGDAADTMIFLEQGRLLALLEKAGKPPVRVAAFLPGAVVGEIGYYAGVPRTATIRSETGCRLRVISRAALDEVAQSDPVLLSEFHEALGELMAKRLNRTTRLMSVLDV